MSTSKKMLARVVKNRCLFFSTAIVTSLVINSQVVAQVNNRADYYDIPAQPLEDSLNAFARQADVEVLYTSDDVRAIAAPAISGAASREQAIGQLLAGTGLTYRFTNSGTLIVRAPDKVSANSTQPGRIELARAAQRTAAAATVGELQGDDEGDWKVDIEEMVVTGSSIRGVAPDSSPLFIYDREDIESAGFSTVEQFIEALPQNFGGGAATDTAGASPNPEAGLNPARGASVNLRGLGAGSTLVLLNGRRLAPVGFGNFVDISLIPLSAIERVEVLTDGASAIYGADAIAGVVNFVLRDDYDGAETLLRYGTVTDGGLDEFKASQVFGKNWGSGNALVTYEYFQRDSLSAADRDFALDAGASPDLDLTPDTEYHNILVSFNQMMTDNFELFADGIYTNRENNFTVISLFNNTLFNTETEQYNISTGGAFLFLDDWRVEVSGSYGANDTDTNLINLLDGTPSDGRLDNKIWTIGSKADGTILRLPGGDAKLALGVGYREEEFDNSVSVFQRDVVSVHSELFLPIVSGSNAIPGVERLEVTAAGRFEDYSDFGSTTDPKVGVLWSPLDGLNFRGTFGTSFKAPDLNDLDISNRTAILFPLPDPNSPTGTTLGLLALGGGVDLGPEESTAWTVGLDYEPDFVPGLRVSATYYDIEFEDRIAQPDTNAFVPLSQPDVFAPVLTFDPTPEQIADFIASAPTFLNLAGAEPEDALVLVDNSVQNLAVTNTSGVDFSLQYDTETDIGQISFSFSGSYIFEFENAVTPVSPRVDVVDTVFNPIDLRLRTSLGWSRDGFSIAAFLNYTDSYNDNTVDPEVGVESFTTVDLSVSYHTGDRFAQGFLNNIRLSVSVQNLLNEDPPFIQGLFPFNTIGYDPANATALNRFVAVQLSKAW